MDEQLRQLQRRALASGDPRDLARYRHAASRRGFGQDMRDDASQPPSRQKIIDLLNFYGIKHIIIENRPGRPERDCNWNGHVLVFAPCPLSRLFSVVSQAIHGAGSSWSLQISGEYDTEIGAYYLLVEHYYSGQLRTRAAKTWFSGDYGIEASIQMVMVLDEMERKGLFIGPLDSSYHFVRSRFIKWVMNNLDDGIREIINSLQDEDHPNSIRIKATIFFWETLNQYEWGFADLLEIYRAYLAANATSSPRQFRKASRKILADYEML